MPGVGSQPMSRVEVVFIELDPVITKDGQWLGRWQAQLLQPAWDRMSGIKRSKLLRIEEELRPNWQGRPGPRTFYRWTTRGTSWRPDGGTRHEVAYSLADAQDRIQKWATRRLTSVEPSPIIRS